MNEGQSGPAAIAAVAFRSDCARNMVIDYELVQPVSADLLARLIPVGLVVNEFSNRVSGAGDHAAGPLGDGSGRVSAVIGSHTLTVTLGSLVHRASPEAMQRFETELVRACGTGLNVRAAHD